MAAPKWQASCLPLSALAGTAGVFIEDPVLQIDNRAAAQIHIAASFPQQTVGQYMPSGAKSVSIPGERKKFFLLRL